MSNCIFCAIVQGQQEASFVHQDELVSVFLDIQPINPGHLLIVPNGHAADLSELPEATGADLFRMAQRMTKLLRRSTLQCEGVTLFLADGAAAMQEVFHVHLHVIPRFQGDGFGMKFPSGYFTKPPRSELEDTAASIRNLID
jgi:histidine triad (HIT) family protein